MMGREGCAPGGKELVLIVINGRKYASYCELCGGADHRIVRERKWQRGSRP